MNTPPARSAISADEKPLRFKRRKKRTKKICNNPLSGLTLTFRPRTHNNITSAHINI